MKNSTDDQFQAKLIAITLTLVTIVVFTRSVTDPVNVTKLFVLGAFGFASLGSFLNIRNLKRLVSLKIASIGYLTFIFTSLSTLFLANSPVTQSLYGVYGRNNGFILYLLLFFMSIATLTLKTPQYFKYFLWALFIGGITNLLYAFWVFLFGDFVGWSNPYGALLGTLGNPNFIGSFFGMFSGLLFTLFFAPEISKRIKILSAALTPLVFFGIVQSHAVQGKVLFVLSFIVVYFYFLRNKFHKNLPVFSFILISGITAIFAILGALQIGPLKSLIYKTSVSLRGEYWFAGWQTGKANPLYGAGFDGYGDWYRRSRRESALELPGVDTVSNTAHNVFLDFFAFGGWPLLISYAIIVLTVFFYVVKYTKENRNFDYIFVGLVVIWVGYQAQSIISINQIGLAIWGWVFSAAIVAYVHNKDIEKIKTESKKSIEKDSRSNSKHVEIFSPQLKAGLFSIIGCLIAIPPLSADMKWRSAILSQDASRVEAVLKPSYLNPQNNFMYLSIIGSFEENGLVQLSHKFTLEAIKFNPNSYELWRALYWLRQSTQTEKSYALINMKRLDPLNPNVGEIGK